MLAAFLFQSQIPVSMLMLKTEAAVVNAHTGITSSNPNRHYAQPKKQTAKKTVPNGGKFVRRGYIHWVEWHELLRSALIGIRRIFVTLYFGQISCVV